MLVTNRSKVSANSPEEVRRRRERHELAGIEVLSGTLGRAARGWDCNAKMVLKSFYGGLGGTL